MGRFTMIFVYFLVYVYFEGSVSFFYTETFDWSIYLWIGEENKTFLPVVLPVFNPHIAHHLIIHQPDELLEWVCSIKEDCDVVLQWSVINVSQQT